MTSRPVKARRHPPPRAHDGAQLWQQPTHLAGIDSDGSATTMSTGSPSWAVTRLHRRGGQPGHVCLLHCPGPAVDVGGPACEQEAERAGSPRGVRRASVITRPTAWPTAASSASLWRIALRHRAVLDVQAHESRRHVTVQWPQ